MISQRMSGCFSDFPYFSPVESILFYNTVSSNGLHKLKRKCEFDGAFFCEGDLKRKIHFPAFFANSNGNPDVFAIRLAKSISVEKEECVDLGFEGINSVWMSLASIDDVAPADRKEMVVNIFRRPSSAQDFLISIFISGVFSILRDREEKKGAIPRIILRLADNEEGNLLATDIFGYISTNFNSTVQLLGSTGDNHVQPTVDASDNCSVWLEKIRTKCINWFEDTCDGGMHSGGTSALFLVLPADATVREAVRKVLADSYTSEPLCLVDERDFADALFSKNTFISICSSGFLYGLKGKTVLSKIKAKTMVHGGCAELSGSLGIDVQLLTDALDMSAAPEFVSVLCGPAPAEGKMGGLLGCYSLFLLISRRFRPTRIGSRECFAFQRHFFLTSASWDFFLKQCSRLELMGVLDYFTVSGNSVFFSFSSFGHFASAEMKVSKDMSLSEPLFSIREKKMLLWSFLLRYSKKCVWPIIKRLHPFDEQIEVHLDEFCRKHCLAFDSGDRNDLGELASILSGSADDHYDQIREGERVFLLLASPSGKRVPLRKSAPEHRSGKCRGWYERALLCPVTSEKGSVSVYCPPLETLYGELQVAGVKYAIECPLEISYPIVVARCALHIIFQNNTTLLECGEKKLLQIPENILFSTVFQSIVKNCRASNVGLWLDGAMCDSQIRKLGTGLLAQLRLTGGSAVSVCRRRSHIKRTRASTVESDGEKRQTNFTGARPRTSFELETIEDFVKIVNDVGKERAEQAFKNKKGFEFIDSQHYLYPFYEFVRLQKDRE